MKKSCAITKTYGERRVASHLLIGIELLLVSEQASNTPPRRYLAPPHSLCYTHTMQPSMAVEVPEATLAARWGATRAKAYTEQLRDPDTFAVTGACPHSH